MIAATRAGVARMSFRSATRERTSRYSARIFSRSRPVRRCRRISRIACAWTASRRRRPSSVRADAEISSDVDAEELLERGLLDDHLRAQPFFRLRGVLARPDDRDDAVEVRERDGEAEQDVRALLGLPEVELRAAHDDRAAVVEEVAEEVLQREDARLPVHDREEDDSERRLQRREREDLVQDDLRDGVALDVDDDAHSLAVGLVADRGDALEAFLVHEVRDELDEPRLVDLERDFRDDDRLAVALLVLLDPRLAAHLQDAASGPVGVHDSLAAEDDPARREVGARQDPEEPGQVGLRVVEEEDGRVARLGEVVRRDLRRHADRDPLRAVHEEVRERAREDDGLLERAVVRQRPVDGLLVDVVADEVVGEAREADLRVAHRGGRVAVHGAEVALPVHERLAQRERLGHADDRVVDRRVAVRVVLAHDVADDAGGLLVRAARAVALLPHPVQDAAVHGLQAVAHVGQGAPDDDGHRVVEVAPPDLLLDGDGDLLRRVDHGGLFGCVGQLKCPGSRRSGRSPR